MSGYPGSTPSSSSRPARTSRSTFCSEDRRRTVLALCRQDPDLAATPEVEVSICLLDDLAERGPFAPVFRTVAETEKAVDWLGEEAG